MVHDVDVIVKRQAHEQKTFKSFKDEKEANERKKLEEEWLAKTNSGSWLDEYKSKAIKEGKFRKKDEKKEQDQLKEYYLFE